MKYIKDIGINMKLLTLLFMLLMNVGLIKNHLHAHEMGNLEQSSLAELVDSTSPSVVTIAIKGKVKAQQNPFFDDPFFERFFGQPQPPREREFGGGGSGVIVDGIQGYIITNHHVIEKADEIKVFLKDGGEYLAELIGSDPGTDIAVLKIELSKTISQMPLGDSSVIRVGDFALAIGAPFGLSQTVTSGIISALGRPQMSSDGYGDFIQTDAAINPGNSGGPLFNMKGEVVGINTAIQSATGEFTGVGFAVPSNTVKKVVPVLIQDGEFKHPWMGISGTDVDPELAEMRELESSKGFVVVSVIEGSPAEKAGMKGVTQTREKDGREFPMDGDIIIGIDGKDVRKISDILVHLQREKSVGDEMILTVLRTGVSFDLTMILEERPR